MLLRRRPLQGALGRLQRRFPLLELPRLIDGIEKQ
jgi:hypothetical protein